MNYTLGMVIHNSIYQYLADAKHYIVEEDEHWDKLEWCAEAIRAYVTDDGLDFCSKDRKVKAAYNKREREFKEAFKWLSNNWLRLWW